MDQPVYLNMNTYRLMPQNPEDQQQQQQQFQSQGIIMTGGDQTQEVLIQDDQSHVVYSPLKQNEQPQFVTQDDSMQNSYLIQSSPQQQPQQVFYANISPQNQNRIQQQQTIALNHNLIAQQNQNQKLVLQPQKVVVQRNSDIMQANNNMQLVDHQNQQTIQYHFAQQMDQNQAQQLIIQQPNQQIKQTIYPQQPNQVVSQPQYYLQQIQPPNIVQQGGTKILMAQGGSPVRYSFLPKQQQIGVQHPGGQIVQINQHQPQLQVQNVQYRPRVTPVRIRVSSPQNQQQQMMNSPRPRVPRPRIVRPAAQNPLLQIQGSPQSNQQPRPQQQGNKIVCFVQTQPDGTRMIIPQSQYSQQGQQQTQQIVRMIPQKAVQANQQQQRNFQIQSNLLNTQVQVQSQSPQQQPPTQVEQPHTPATSTFTPKKDGDCDDLEESITATAISKSSRSEPPPLQPSSSISLDDYRKRGNMQMKPLGIVRPANQLNQIRAQAKNPALQVIRQRPAPRPPFNQQAGLNQELEAQERESAKMLVILDNGEQRLITFTLPKETCTVQELLDQVGIQVGADSNIECIENPGSEIDYIVKVGNFASRDTAAMTKAAENHIRQQQHRQQQIQSQRNTIQQHQQSVPVDGNSKSPEPKALPAKFVPGFYALCGGCGFSSQDHAKCIRCNRVFHDDPKVIRMTAANQPQKTLTLQTIGGTTTQKITMVRQGMDKKDQMEALQKKHQMVQAKMAIRGGRGGMTTSTPRGGRGPRGGRAKITIPEIVTLSSEDEDSEESKSSGAKNQSAKKEDDGVPRKPFEPEIVDDIAADDFVRSDVTEIESKLTTSITCRTVRIGTFKFDSKEKVVMTCKGIKIVAPTVPNAKECVTLNIMHEEIVKVVIHFSKQLHIVFVYIKPSCARYIAAELQMSQTTEKSPFFSPLSRSEPQRKIVFLAESVTEETKAMIKSIYSRPILEEINNRDANEMLVRSTGIPLNNSNAAVLATPNNTADGSLLQDPEIKKLLIYPPGRGGHAINTNDFVCLGSDNYLNDVIIDFYLTYLHRDILTEEQSKRTYIFSQFFYKRLTTLTKDASLKLTAAQKRHVRVASWTKNVNLFEKDFIIIPINENQHWFLAIICFAYLTEPHTMDTNQPIKLLTVQKRAKNKAAATVQIGNTTITPLTKKEDTINVGDDEGSERDEAEGEESDLGDNLESDDEEEVVDKGQPVKVPCILIFDSLPGAPRSRVVATLRDYLTCEYKAKYPNEPLRQYTKNNIFGNQVKVPIQNNYTDCGLFLLQYVEQFFKEPIKDFRIPIKNLNKWFHQDVVTRKREEIANLIEDLIKKTAPTEDIELPVLLFPTKDGKILEVAPEPDVNENAFDDDEYVPTEEDLKEAEQNGSKLPQGVETKRVYFSKKRSLDKNDSSSGESGAKIPKFSAKVK